MSFGVTAPGAEEDRRRPAACLRLLLGPALAVISLLFAGGAPAQSSGAFASGQLAIQGTRLSIAPGDESQILDVAESARVRTCFAGVCGSMAAGDPRVNGLLVKAELSGPELQAPATYTATPGGAFLLPGVQTEGTYLLSNIRLVRAAVPPGATEEVLGQATPAVVTLEVRRILATTATVRQLTLAELQARGIQITQQNYDAYSFAVGFAFQGGNVTIDFPVLFQDGGQVDLLSKPEVKLDDLSEELAAAVRRWQPPHIVPFKLEVGGSEGLVTSEEIEELPPETRLFGVIVLPGNVSFLHKFFDAQLLVANGAPAGSGAVLSNVTSTIRLPAAVPRELLRLAGTTPAVAPGQAVPVLGLTGETHLGPGEQGVASFTLEGVAAGTHVVTMEVAADLERPGRDTLPLSGKLRAAIEVVDARFNLAFNHPDVVREDEAYTLFVTVTNVSARDWENAITLALDADRATGAVKADPGDSFQRRIETLGPGEGATVEFRLVAKVTGRCVATAFQSSDAVQGVIRLRAGVGEHGIPLSPSSLVLPRFTELLPEPLVAANVPLLGLAYSLAVAPPGAIPTDLPRLVKSDVARRAVDLAEAGQRLFLGEERLPSLEALLLDQLGNRHDLPEFDQLRRTLEKGRGSAEGIASFLRQEQEARSLAASALLEHLAGTMSYARPYVAATLESAGPGTAPTLEVRKLNGVTGVTYLAYSAGDPRALRSLAFGETYDVLDRPGGARAPLAVVGRLSGEAGYALVVHGPISGSAMPVTLSFVAPAPSGDGFVRVSFPPFAVPPREAWAVDVVRAETDGRPLEYSLYHLATGIPVPGAPSADVLDVERPPFRLIGARQDFVLDPYGSGVWYLFNRPPAKTAAETASHYEVETRFRGLDTTSSGTVHERTTVFSAASALVQPSSERVVAVRFAQPISAITAVHEGQPVISHEHRVDMSGLRDGWGDALGGPVPAIEVEPNHVGGLVEGRVLRGTGEAVAGAVVRLIRDRVVEMNGGVDARVFHDLVAERVTDASGEFFFPFIEEPVLGVPRPPEKGVVQSGFRIQAVAAAGTDPGSPEEGEEVTSTIRLQSRLARVNIAMLGRGTITGRVFYEDSAPVPAAAVTAASTLFPEVRSTEANVDGTFRLEAMPVGPITITARDATGRSSYATVGLAAPGATADVTLRIQRTETPRTGTVSGRVFIRRESSEGPVTEPASGASVAVYSAGAPFGQSTTGPGGAFLFEGIPAGRVTVQAADFSVSRTPAIVDTDLAPDATANVVLTLAAARPRSVSGQVLYRDPLAQVDVPVAGATVFVEGPGNYALTDETGIYRIDGVPAQGVGEPPYRVHAIDFVRKLEGTTAVSVTEASPDPVVAGTIQLRGTAVGAIDGVVLDPLGLPAAGVKVTLLPIGETTSGADGTFAFEEVPARAYTVSAHKGDGLQTGAIGWIGAAGTEVLFGGHRAFATVRLRGAGTVHVKTRTANGPVRTPVFYKPTWFSPQELTIRQKASAIETTTDDNGSLTLVVPVGDLSVSGVSPFYGAASYRGAIDFAGQVKEVDLVFQPLSTVAGTVVDVDGVTPVAGVTIELRAHELPPQTMQTGSLGEFEFALVPTGPLALTASGFVGTIERTGRTYAAITGPGQSLDVVVRLKAKGTVRGRVVEETAPGVRSPVAGAQVALQENDFPFRRLPAAPGYFTADAIGRFAVSDVMAGRFTVVARHPGQVTRQGRLVGALNADFEVVEAGDVVLSGQVGDLTVLVRDAQTGSPVPDAQVTLSNGEATVAGADGRAQFVALPLGTWSVYAFHAPTGSGGRLADIHLDAAGQSLEVVVVLDQKGRVSGTLFDDEARTTPIGGGTVRLEGTVNGRLWGARVTALATTSREDGSLGKFAFDGLPVATYSLTAAVEGSDRRAEGTATLTPTAPEPEIVLILDAVREVYARVYQKEQARGLVEVNPDPAQGDGVFAVSYGRHWNVYTGEPIPIASRLLPDRPFPNHHFRFTNVLAAKSFWIRAEESSGERRRVLVTSASLASGSLGSGTEADPYKVVLKARGVVRVTVRDAGGAVVAGATVRLHAANGTWESATDSGGRAAFSAVEEGTVSVSASIPGSPFGASASRVLEWDDQVLDVDLALSPVVSAHGVVYEAPEDDSWDGDPSRLQPAEGVSVRIQPSAGDAQQLITGADGTFRFSGLAPGGYTIAAQSLDGSRIARASGTLGSEHGTDYLIPPLILDASRPRIVTLSPPNGASSVSRTAPVEILFSERLHSSVVPSGPSSAYFHLTFGPSTAAGAWSSFIDEQGRQVVRFTPAPRYENSTTYSLRIEGGPSGVRDLEGRPLTDSGDIGASFTTSDTDGPRVVGTVPSLARPVDPETPIRIDFGEVLVLSSAQLQASILFEWKSTGGAWAVHPVTVSLTRGGYSILVDQPAGVTFTDDSLRRRLTVSGLTDASGNAMPAWMGEYRIYDENPPVLSIGLPPNAPTGDLSASASYTLSPSFTAPDDVTPENPFGDVDRVEYTFGSALDPTQPASSPGAVLTTAPFALGFVASYVGDGANPRPFPVWVKAFDTSGNPSEQLRLDMRVLPNTPPDVSGVTVSATAPVAGITYAGSTLSATAGGLADGDDARLTVSAELRRGTADSSELVSSAPARSVDRPAEGWGALPPQAFSFTIPIVEPEGTALFVRVRAVDSKGAAGAADAAFVVADDAADPVVTDLVARRPNGDAATSFVIGETFVLEVTVHDSETGVKGLVVATSGGFLPPTLAATRVGTTDLFRTESVTVPATLTEPVHVVVTATAEDFGGNDDVGTLELDLAPSSDPTMPVIEWLSPFEGGLWPASYVSVDPGKAGVDLLLRLRVTDRDLDGSGNEVPGSIASVRFRGPADASGTLSSDWTVAAALPGAMAGEWIYEGVWRVPNGVVPGTALSFTAEAVDAGANKATKTVTLQTVAARYVYEAATTSVGSGSEIPAPAGDEALPIFLLDGTTLSLYPKNAGGPRSYASLHLYSGGTLSAGAGSPVSVRRTTLTSPEVTSYESLVSYYPLELSIGETLGVAHGAAIDVTGRGLLGGDATHSPVALPGERASLAGAGGSHGGMGQLHPPFAEWPSHLGDPGSVYGSIRNPLHPGGGGGRNGGTGGGVLRISAPDATVQLFGDLVADGNLPPRSAPAGAAGGSVRLVANRLQGRGSVRANGSSVPHGTYGPGGGGGRVSVSWTEPPTPSITVVASGAVSAFPQGDPSGPAALAGAGTVFLERTDSAGSPVDRGLLRISNPVSDDPAGLTPLPGFGAFAVTDLDVASRTITIRAPSALGSIEGDLVHLAVRSAASGSETSLIVPVSTQTRTAGSAGSSDQEFALTVEATEAELAPVATALSAGDTVTARARLAFAAFEARGAARVVVDSELEIMGTVDDRASLALDGSARVLLGGESPSITFDGTTPATGSNVVPNATIEISYKAIDSLGISRLEETWFTAETTTVRASGEALAAPPEGTLIRVTVPPAQPAGPATYRVRAINRAGRATEVTASWNVVGDTTPPVITGVYLSPEHAGDSYVSGEGIFIHAFAEDDSAVASMRIDLGGASSERSGSYVDLDWLVPMVDQITDFTLTVSAADAAGNVRKSLRTIHVSPRQNAVSPSVAIECPSSGALLPSGYASFAMEARAMDDEGVQLVSFYRESETTPYATVYAPEEYQKSFVAVAPLVALPTVAQPTVVRFRARGMDFAGNVSAEVSTDVSVVPAVELLASGVNDWPALTGETVYLASGSLVLDEPRTFGGLIVLRGASITHPPGGTHRLDLTVSGPLFIECGGSIDVTGKGYSAGMTYGGPQDAVHGPSSHIGQGPAAAASSTFGSVERPLEAGAGGSGGTVGGGGVVRLRAGMLSFGGPTASIQAKGASEYSYAGGGGGSIWITAASMVGDGLLDASGGDGGQYNYYGGTRYQPGGGGGALRIDHSSTAGAALARARARGGAGEGYSEYGGSGTVLLVGPTATFGALHVVSAAYASPWANRTVLPTLGSGTAEPQTAGATLVTGRSEAIPAYFAGHWVEVRRGENLLGTWRIGAISDRTVTLEANGSEVIELRGGDLWQGVYRFDSVEIGGKAMLESVDPIRTPITELSGPTEDGKYLELPESLRGVAVTVIGNVSTPGIEATDLTLIAGARLTHPASTGTQARGLELQVTGTLTIEAGASIDVTSRGYPGFTTYPGASTMIVKGGGSHIGLGEFSGSVPPGLTYGSVGRPREAGSGAWGMYRSGGGVVRIRAGEIVFEGTSSSILADGESFGCYPYDSVGGAGGSIWITTSAITGDGTIHAAGGTGCLDGGGGAVSIEYVSATGTALTRVGRNESRSGTVVLKGPGDTLGHLRVEGWGAGAAVLPALGGGIAKEGTIGATLVTDRTLSIPAYFVGHWVEILREGSLLGSWRIESVTDTTVMLEPNGTETIDLVSGDHWQGVYRFDSVMAPSGRRLMSADPIRDRLPTIDVSAPLAGASFASGAAIPVRFAATDDWGVAKVILTLGDNVVEVPGPSATSGSIEAPWVAAGTSMSLDVAVVDLAGQRVSTSIPLAVLPTTPLTASISSPEPDRNLWGGTTPTVTIHVPDARPIRRITLTLGADQTTHEALTGPSMSVSLPIAPVGADEARTLIARVEDEFGGEATASVPVFVLADTGPRVVAFVDEESPVSAGTWIGVRFVGSFRNPVGAQMRVTVSGAVTHEELWEAPTLSGTDWEDWFGFQIPDDARGPMRIVMTAIDGAGRVASTDPIELEVTSSFSIAVVGSGVVAPGGTLELALSASGWNLPDSVDLAIQGAFDWARPVELGESYGESDTVSRTIRIPVPRNALGDGAAAFVAHMDGGEGGYSRGALAAKLDEGMATSNTVTFSVVDDIDPVVARVRSSRWGLVSGAEASFRADVFDNGTVQVVRFLVDGVLIATISEPTETSTYESGPHLLPSAADERNVVVRVEATDLAGRTSSAERTFVVAPAGTPLVRFRAPTSGAMAVAGQTLPLVTELRHPRPITQVAFYRDDEATPFATRSGEELAAEFLVPPDATPGSEIKLWVEATDDLGAVGEASAAVRVVVGTLLTDGTILDADDASHEDEAIVVQGRVEVRGEHQFARLVVLPGAVLTHAATAGETVERLDLEVTGDVYVSPTATIDAIGLGFEGGLQGSNPSPEGRTLPGRQGAQAGFGGSHAGMGEVGDEGVSAEAFGTCRAPDLPGGGGGAAPNGDPGGPGGGVIRLRVGGRLIVDGAIDASGASGEGGAAGAGGSVHLEAISIGGSGWVHATGGDPGALVGRGGSAGGGRIAVLGSLEDAAPELSSASGPAWYASGGAGTLFLRSPEDLHGHLVVDAGASSRVGWTYLAEVGWRWGNLAGEDDLVVTIDPFPVDVDLVGTSIEITRDDALVGRFRIEESRPQEGSVTLDESAARLLPSWGFDLRGVQVFDTVNVEGRARLEVPEVLEGVVRVGPAARMWTDDEEHCPEDSSPALWAATGSGQGYPGGNVEIDVESDDSNYCSSGGAPGQVVQYSVWVDGVEGSLLEVPIEGAPGQDARQLTYVLPASLPFGEYLLVVEVRDQTNQKTATAFRIRVSEEPGLVERLPAGSGQRSHPLSLRPSKRFARPAREGAGPVRVRTTGRGPQEPH